MDLSRTQRAALWKHYQRVVDVNRRFNLTRITAPHAFAIKHHADSLATARWACKFGVQVRRLLDIGTGAGLPALPLAVANPQWQVTAIDGAGKKAIFVAQLADQIGVTNLQSICARAESWHCGKPFDVVVLKAVGPIGRCLEFARPHLLFGGWAIVYKTARLPPEELSQGAVAAKKLGFSEPSIYGYELRLAGEILTRTLRIYRLLLRHAPFDRLGPTEWRPRDSLDS